MTDEDDADHNDQRGSIYDIPVGIAAGKNFIPPDDQQHAHGYCIKRDRQQHHNDLADRAVEPVEIAAQAEMQVTVSFPNDERDTNGVEITQLDLPKREPAMIDHARNNRDDDTESWDEDQPEADIIYFQLYAGCLRRQVIMVRRPCFHIYTICVCTVKIRK